MTVIDPLEPELFRTLMLTYQKLKKPGDPMIDVALYEDIYQEMIGSEAWVVHDDQWHGFILLVLSQSGILLNPYFFGSVPMVEEGYDHLADDLMTRSIEFFEEHPCDRLYTVIKAQPDQMAKELYLRKFAIDFDYEYVEMQWPIQGYKSKVIIKNNVNLRPVSDYGIDALKACFDAAFATSDVKYYHNMSARERLTFFDQVSLPGVFEHPSSMAVEVKGQLAGFILVFDYHGQPYITSMCLLAPYRSQGYGRYLLDQCASIAGSNGYKTLSLGTEIQMKAYDLYQSQGFHVVASKKYYLRKKNG